MTSNNFITKKWILGVARDNAPHVVDVNITKKQHFTSITMKWKDYHLVDDRSEVILWSDDLFAIRNSEILKKEREKLTGKIISALSNFGKDECDALITAFNLKEVYRDKFEDKNVLYKVNYLHKRKIGRVVRNRNIGFHYYDQVKMLVPFLYYFWIGILLKDIKHKNVNGLFDISLSLCKKFEQIFFTYDLIHDIINTSKNIENPGTFFAIYNQFTQFVPLIKSIGDNLAWTLNLYQDLNLNYKLIDLLGKKFKASIKKPYNDLYQFDYIRHFISLKNLRDIIQHRAILRSMRAIIIETQEKKIVIPKNPEALFDESLKVSSTSNNEFTQLYDDPVGIVLDGYYETVTLPFYTYLKDYDDIFVFCDRHLNGIFQLTNFIFKKIIIDEMGEKIGEVKDYNHEEGMAEVKTKGPLKIGDKLLIDGRYTSVIQTNKLMKLNGNNVKEYMIGDISIKTEEPLRKGDMLYMIKNYDRIIGNLTNV